MNDNWKEKLVYEVTNEVVYVDDQMSRNIDVVIDALPERERDVLKMRFEQGMTLEECGKRFNVTKERIRQCQAKAIRMLKHPSRKRFIMSGLKCADIDFEIATLEGVKKRRQEFADKVQRINELKKELEETEQIIQELLKEGRKSEFEAKSTAELDLSVRPYNCLVRAGYQTWADFEGMTMNQLVRIRNMGKKSALEVYDALVRNGIIINNPEERGKVAKLYEGN